MSSDSSNKDSGASETKTEQQTTVASKAISTFERKLLSRKLLFSEFTPFKRKLKEVLVNQENSPAQYAGDSKLERRSQIIPRDTTSFKRKSMDVLVNSEKLPSKKKLTTL